MPTRLLALALALSFAAASLLASPAAAQNSPAAQRVLERARMASGGAGWYALRGIHETGQDADGPYERWIDPVRYGDRTDIKTPKGLFVQGYNGGYEWRILTNGAVTGSEDRTVNARVRTEAFFAAHGYFFPGRFDMRGELIGQRQAGGRTFDVVRVQPAGGNPRELWFDRSTGLLGQMVDESGPKRITTEFSDYRRAGAIMTPYLRRTYGGDLAAPAERRLEKIDFAPADRGVFTLPPERVHARPQQPAATPAPPEDAPLPRRGAKRSR